MIRTVSCWPVRAFFALLLAPLLFAACNSGNSGSSGGGTVTPGGGGVTAPADVTGFTAASTGVSGQLQLSWTGSASANVANYYIANEAGSPAIAPVTVVALAQPDDANTYSILVNGLTDGTAYTVLLQSRNATGISSSGVTATATPMILNEVSGVVATATGASGQVLLTWTGSSSTNVADYYVTGAPVFSPVTRVSLAAPGTPDNVPYSVSVDGLTNGTLYTFRVQARTSTGASTTGLTATATPFIYEVTGVTATATGASGQVELQWTGSRSGNVASYQIENAAGTPAFTTVTVTATAKPDDANTYTRTLTGLANGTAYTFVIRTKCDDNNVSTGVSASATPFMYDVTVFSATATGISGQVRLDWTGTLCPNVARYVISSPGGAPAFTTVTQAATAQPDDANTYTIYVNGLTDGTLYTFWIRVQDDASNLSPGMTQQATPFTLGEVTGLTATPTGTSGEVRLDWTGSASLGVTGYLIDNATGTPAFTPVSVTAVAGPGAPDNVAYSRLVTGLTNYTEYTFRVRAQSGAGLSQGVTVLATPFVYEVTNFVAVPTGASGQVRLSWVGSRSGNVASYYITGVPAFTPVTVTAIAQPDDANDYTTLIDGLTDGTLYTFRIQVDDGTQKSTGVTTQATPYLTVRPAPHGGIYNGPVRVIFNYNYALGGTVRYTTNDADPDPSPTSGSTWSFGNAPFTLFAAPPTPGTHIRLRYMLAQGAGQTAVATELYEYSMKSFVASEPFFDKYSGMKASREGHTATLLTTSGAPDDVAVIGGNTNGDPDFSMERYVSKYGHFDLSTDYPGGTGMSTLRQYHAAAVLDLGRVLVTGGRTGSDPDSAVGDVEIYDSTTNSFSAGTPLLRARAHHTATRLYDKSVLVLGGVDATDPASLVGSFAAANDSASATSITVLGNLLGIVDLGYWVNVGSEWGVVTNLSVVLDPIVGPKSTLTVDGLLTKILTGAFDVYYPGVSGLEHYSPAGAALAAPGAALSLPRFGHTATLLDSGRVLVAGGANRFDPLDTSDRVLWLYNHVADAFEPADLLSTIRFFHTATKLKDGKVLIAGGMARGDSIFHATGLKGAVLSSAEIFDPVTGDVTATGSMTKSRFGHSAALLQDGRVLIVGGAVAIDTSTKREVFEDSADLYDPVTGTFTALTTNEIRGYNQSVTLSDGRVLILGGAGDFAELFDPATGLFNAAAHAVAAGRQYGAAATGIPDGRILISGGQTIHGDMLDNTEVYSMASISSTMVPGTMNASRRFHTSTRLVDPTPTVAKAAWHGKILIAGGENADGAVSACEVFDPVSGTFSSTGPMRFGRYDHAATRLPDGRVLVTGGSLINMGLGGPLSTGEIYDPVTGTWADAANAMSKARTQHVAVLIPPHPSVRADLRNKVLILGGNSEYDTSAELFDPDDNSFKAIAGGNAMSTGRRGFAAVNRCYSRGLARFRNGQPDVAGFETGWVNPLLASRPVAGDLICCELDGALYRITAPLSPVGYGPEVDASLTLQDVTTGVATNYAGLDTLGYVPYVILKQDIFVAGGEGGALETDLFSGATGTFAPSVPMGEGRYRLTMDAIADGRILLAGGFVAEGSGRLFNPAAGTYSPSPVALTDSYVYHYMTRLFNGLMLVLRNHSAEVFFPD